MQKFRLVMDCEGQEYTSRQKVEYSFEAETAIEIGDNINNFMAGCGYIGKFVWDIDGE